jgi:cytidylate kinase
LVAKQREIANKALKQGIAVVAEGRDVATKVFPDADLKVFLTATPQIRAQRRLKQIEARGREADFNQVLEDVEIRDKRDEEREIDPLVKDPQAFGYIILDNSNMSEEATIDFILQKVKELNGQA